MRSIVIAGGGTGGHLFSAIAFADYVKRQGYEPFIVGSEYGMESSFLKNKGYSYRLLKTRGFAGKGFKEKLGSVYLMLRSSREAVSLIKRLNPLFVIGFGGYTTVSVLLSARLLGVPTAVVEQNSVPGKANRLLAHFCDFLFVNFEMTKKFFPNRKVYVSGNPIREDIYIPERSFEGPVLRVGVLGGSRGARTINRAMMELAIGGALKGVEVIHQTGSEELDRVKEVYRKYRPGWKAKAFIDDMVGFYRDIDFIVCRSGAGTLGEIACASLGSVLVPYPYAIYNHQLYNAKEFEKVEASVVVSDKDLTGKRLESIISSLNRERLALMSERAFSLCKRGASRMILETVLSGIG